MIGHIFKRLGYPEYWYVSEILQYPDVHYYKLLLIADNNRYILKTLEEMKKDYTMYS